MPSVVASRLALSPLTTRRRVPSLTVRRLALPLTIFSLPGAVRHLSPLTTRRCAPSLSALRLAPS
eukprot:5730897-Pleurochrysis_carterae.AAC.1